MMKKFELNKMGVVELNPAEEKEVSGGAFLCILLGVMLFSACVALYTEIVD